MMLVVWVPLGQRLGQNPIGSVGRASDWPLHHSDVMLAVADAQFWAVKIKEERMPRVPPNVGVGSSGWIRQQVVTLCTNVRALARRAVAGVQQIRRRMLEPAVCILAGLQHELHPAQQAQQLLVYMFCALPRTCVRKPLYDVQRYHSSN